MTRDAFYGQTRSASTSTSTDAIYYPVDTVITFITVPTTTPDDTVAIAHFAPKKAKSYNADNGYGHFNGAYPYVMHGYPLYVPRFESIVVPSQPDANGNLKVRMVIKNQNK